MVFADALKALEEGLAAYREDWGWSSHAYITLEDFMGTKQFYITGPYNDSSSMKMGYCLTYSCLISEMWAIR